MAENSYSLSRRLNDEGIRPGATLKHKRTGNGITVGRISKGKVFTDKHGTGRAGWVQNYDVVKPNFAGDQNWFGKISTGPIRSSRSRWSDY